MNIVLTGMMGTGKTSVGKKLVRRLGMKYIDTDEMIRKDTGKTIPQIFEQDGEKKFRDIEKKAVKVVSMLNNYVISTGGGAVKNTQNIEELERNSIVVCLYADADTIYKRTKKHSHRPLLNVKDPIKAINNLLAERKKFYRRCDLMLDTSKKSINQITEEIIKFIKEKRES